MSSRSRRAGGVLLLGLAGCAEPSPAPSTPVPPSSSSEPADGPTVERSACTGSPVAFSYRSVRSRGRNGRSSSELEGLVVAGTLALTYESNSGGKPGSSWTGVLRGPVVESTVAELARPQSRRVYAKTDRRPTGGSRRSLEVTFANGCTTSGNDLSTGVLQELRSEAQRRARGEENGRSPTAKSRGAAGIRAIVPPETHSVELRCTDGRRLRRRVTSTQVDFDEVEAGLECTLRIRGKQTAITTAPVRAPATLRCAEAGGKLRCEED